jgi:hypothetical protein
VEEEGALYSQTLTERDGMHLDRCGKGKRVISPVIILGYFIYS